MNMKVTLRCNGEEIDEFDIPMSDVVHYLGLIKMYGYEDMSGEGYECVSVSIEGISISIYLVKKDEE